MLVYVLCFHLINLRDKVCACCLFIDRWHTHHKPLLCGIFFSHHCKQYRVGRGCVLSSDHLKTVCREFWRRQANIAEAAGKKPATGIKLFEAAQPVRPLRNTSWQCVCVGKSALYIVGANEQQLDGQVADPRGSHVISLEPGEVCAVIRWGCVCQAFLLRRTFQSHEKITDGNFPNAAPRSTSPQRKSWLCGFALWKFCGVFFLLQLVPINCQITKWLGRSCKGCLLCCSIFYFTRSAINL